MKGFLKAVRSVNLGGFGKIQLELSVQPKPAQLLIRHGESHRMNGNLELRHYCEIQILTD